MTVIGLTGGIGMGKSTAAELLARQDIPVIDTDVLARRVVEPGQPALAGCPVLPSSAEASPHVSQASLEFSVSSSKSQLRGFPSMS